VTNSTGRCIPAPAAGALQGSCRRPGVGNKSRYGECPERGWGISTSLISDERAVVLHRTRYRWQAPRWVRDFGRGLRTPILVAPHGLTPQYESMRPLYPDPDRPLGMDEQVLGRMPGKPRRLRKVVVTRLRGS